MYNAIYGTDFDEKNNGFASTFIRLQKEMFAGKLEDIDNKDPDTGILIGPEFSRIYAEIILQAVDRELETTLRKRHYSPGKEYSFYRYVDDGFFFCKDKNLMQNFVWIYNEILHKWGLKINVNKKKVFYEHPFVEPLTIAKRELNLVVDKMFTNRLETLIGIRNRSQDRYSDIPFKIESKYFIRDIQGIIVKYNCKYEDVTAVLLSAIRRKLQKDIYKPFFDAYKVYKDASIRSVIDSEGSRILCRYEDSFIDFCGELASLLFYLYACDPRMGTSLKVGQLILEMLTFVEGSISMGKKKIPQFSEIKRMRLYKKINDELRHILIHTSVNEIGIELTNLLLIWHKLSENSRPTEKFLESRLLGNDNLLPREMNFLTVFTLEHLVGHWYKESNLQTEISKWVKQKVIETHASDSAEAVYVFLIALTCPYFNEAYKHCLCEIRGVSNADSLIQLLTRKFSDLFVNWEFKEMLWMNTQKITAEVY